MSPTRQSVLRGRWKRLLAPLLVVVALAAVVVVPSAVAATGSGSVWHSLFGATRRDGAPTPAKKSPSSLSGLVVAPSPEASASSDPLLLAAPGSVSPSARPAASPSTSSSPAPSSSAAYPFTGASVWRTSVASAPLDPDSAAMIPTLTATVTDRYNGIAAFNVWDYNTSYYVADASTPRVDVLFSDCQNKGSTPPGVTGPGGFLTQVPVPSNAVAANGTDSTYSVYSPSTDQLWELWLFRKNTAGQWTACWGGRIDGVSTSNGAFASPFGSTASGLAQTGGMITLADARSLTINHAMDLAIPDPASWGTFRWPASRSDGNTSTPNAIPEGSRLRLDPSVNVASLGLSPIAAAIARAAQTYGFIVTDKAGAVSVRTESGQAAAAATGVDPWQAILASTPNYQVMAHFPWDRMQVVAADYGRH